MNKVAILTELRRVLLEKKEALSSMVADLQQGLADDTKSSAGDKYETSREMSNQELEKLGIQLAEINRQLALLHQVETAPPATEIATGAYVSTGNAHFLIGIPAGIIHVNGTPVFCISSGAPAAQAMLQRTTGETIRFNGQSWHIRAVS